MAYRGGRGGFRFQHFKPDKQEPFILYPEDVALPDKKCVPLDKDFYYWNNKLQLYFENSAYFVENSASRDNQPCDIETYTESTKPRNKMKREALSDYMKLKPGYFPSELVQGVKARPQKKVKWNTDEESENLQSLFTKIGKRTNEKRGEKNKEEEEEEDEEDDDEEKEEDYSSGGDYEQNEDFDDDEDDFNVEDDGDDEPFF